MLTPQERPGRRSPIDGGRRCARHGSSGHGRRLHAGWRSDVDLAAELREQHDKFYLLTSADQMTATFNTIGTNLTKLRVAQ